MSRLPVYQPCHCSRHGLLLFKAIAKAQLLQHFQYPRSITQNQFGHSHHDDTKSQFFFTFPHLRRLSPPI